jgi:hypothetical protein
MAKNSIRDFDNTSGNNTDIQSVDISEGCSPAGINNAIREVMADLADVNDGTVALTSPSADSMTVTGDLTVDTNTLHVDSSNNRVGVGTASPTDVFEVNGGTLNGTTYITATNNHSDQFISMGINANVGEIAVDNADVMTFGHYDNFSAKTYTERMRIDSLGNVLVDKTSTSVSDNGIMLKINGQAFSTTAGANTYHYYDSSNSRYNFYVLGNGGIANYSSNNVALSDQTEKKNIVTAPSAWDDVKGLSIKEFHYNFEDDADPKKLGVIAQDVQVNHPNLITEFEIDESTTKLGVVEQQITWMAVKALQEAIAKIETLETKVAALEAE